VLVRECVEAGTVVGTVPQEVLRSVRCNARLAGHDDHPINCVTWLQAKHFCEWSGHPGGARRLPREAEREYAARGTDDRRYPWGDAAPDDTRLWWSGRTTRDGTASVGGHPTGASPFGALDMAGNVWEWVADEYRRDAYRLHSPDGRIPDDPHPAANGSRVTRGGSWLYRDEGRARTTARGGIPAMDRYHDLGVRFASDGTP